jgi:hypothetical protein
LYLETTTSTQARASLQFHPHAPDSPKRVTDIGGAANAVNDAAGKSKNTTGEEACARWLASQKFRLPATATSYRTAAKRIVA